jgi:hypothetical protein
MEMHDATLAVPRHYHLSDERRWEILPLLPRRGRGCWRVAAQAVTSTEGFADTLAGAKAWLEHGVRLNLVRDKFPDRGPG